jgi:acyl carrier protein
MGSGDTTDIGIDDVARIMGEVIPLSLGEVRSEAVLGEDIPVDSQEMLRVISRLEARFQRRFDPARLLQVRTLGDLTDALREGDR